MPLILRGMSDLNLPQGTRVKLRKEEKLTNMSFLRKEKNEKKWGGQSLELPDCVLNFGLYTKCSELIPSSLQSSADTIEESSTYASKVSSKTAASTEKPPLKNTKYSAADHLLKYNELYAHLHSCKVLIYFF